MWTATSTGAPYAAGTPLVSRTERHKRNCIFTTPGQQCEARTNEGPDPMPIRLWRTERLRRF